MTRTIHMKSDTISTVLLAAVAAAMVSLAVAGGWNAYSPIPFWDMWDGTTGFMVGLHDGHTGLWWAQHNEHRIVLSRLLFWLDYRLFGGKSAFLLVVNFVLAAAACAVFLQYIRRLHEQRETSAMPWALWFFIIAMMFSWMQEQNLAWGFQSQFFLAQLMPLAALYQLARSAHTGSRPAFWAAAALGVLSAGTMANGILALPLMVLMSFLVPIDWHKRALLAAAAVCVPVVYFRGFFRPGSHSSLTETLMEMPGALAEYTLRYLGSPLYHLLGGGSFGHSLSLAGGLVMAWASLSLAWRLWQNKQRSPYLVALILFIAYIAATAFGTGSGRVVFGIDQALSSRYTTPALMAWAALLIALRYAGDPGLFGNRVRTAVAAAIACAALLLSQMPALDAKSEEKANRSVAAMAVSLRIPDSLMISAIYPVPEPPIAVNKRAAEIGISPLNVAPYTAMTERLGKPTAIPAATQCQGWLDALQIIDETDDYVRIAGWVFNPEAGRAPERLQLVDADHIMQGFAFTGIPRPDVAEAVNPAAGYTGFIGYLKRDAMRRPLTGLGEEPACIVALNPEPLELTRAR